MFAENLILNSYYTKIVLKKCVYWVEHFYLQNMSRSRSQLQGLMARSRITKAPASTTPRTGDQYYGVKCSIPNDSSRRKCVIKNFQRA